MSYGDVSSFQSEQWVDTGIFWCFLYAIVKMDTERHNVMIMVLMYVTNPFTHSCHRWVLFVGVTAESSRPHAIKSRDSLTGSGKFCSR